MRITLTLSENNNPGPGEVVYDHEYNSLKFVNNYGRWLIVDLDGFQFTLHESVNPDKAPKAAESFIPGLELDNTTRPFVEGRNEQVQGTPSIPYFAIARDSISECKVGGAVLPSTDITLTPKQLVEVIDAARGEQ